MKYGNFVNKTTIFQTVPTSRRTTQNMATKIIIFFFFTEPKDHTRQKYSQRNLFCILMRFFSSVLAWNWIWKFNHQTFEDNELRLFILTLVLICINLNTGCSNETCQKFKNEKTTAVLMRVHIYLEHPVTIFKTRTTFFMCILKHFLIY